MKFREHCSQLGFSILVPEKGSWGHNENLKNADLALQEQESQRKRTEIENDLGISDINKTIALMHLETLSGLGIGYLMVVGMARKVFYEGLIEESSKNQKALERDRSSVAQMKFLLSALEETQKEWKSYICATTLLLSLQRKTDGERLKAKEELGLRLGYFELGEDKNKDSPYMYIMKLKMRKEITPVELYLLYKKSLPVSFWSGISDKCSNVSNITVDNNDMLKVDKYVLYDEQDFMDVYAVKGVTGWIISCAAFNFRKYKDLFEKLVGSFRLVDLPPKK